MVIVTGTALDTTDDAAREILALMLEDGARDPAPYLPSDG